MKTNETPKSDPPPGLPPPPELDRRTVHQRFIAVKNEITAVPKDQTHEQQKFPFRGIEGLYNHLKSIMAKHGLFMLPQVMKIETEERTSHNDKAMIYRILTVDYYVYGAAGDELPRPIRVIGEAMDVGGDRASSKAQSSADKVCLIQAFKIPTADPGADPDATTTDTAKPGRQDRSRGQETVNRYRWGDKAKGKLLTSGSLEYLQQYRKEVARALEDGRPYVSKAHLDAIFQEIADRQKQAAGAAGEPEPWDAPGLCASCGGELENGFCIRCGLAADGSGARD
jgi:hypothetical protein